MSRRAGVISIDVSAGTAQFAADMDKASAKLRQFGSAAHGSVSNVQATSAALRVMEGNMTNNIRAAERFLATLPGMGTALQAAFPIVGAIALAGVLSEMTTRVGTFMKSLENAPEKMRGAFREVNASIALTNNSLRVSNDRLENDIAKLEGKRENTLKLALDEARESADKLAESLERDLASTDKILRDQGTGMWHHILTGLFSSGDTQDIAKELGGETGYGGFRGRIADVSDPAKLRNAYDSEIRVFKNARVDAEAFQANPKGRGAIFNLQGQGGYNGIRGDMTARIEALKGVLVQLQRESDSIALHGKNEAVTKTKEALTQSAENSALGKPFEDRLKSIGAQIDATKAKLDAIGNPESAQIIGKAFGDAQKAIEEVNKELEKHHTQLTADQKTQIEVKELTLATAEAEATWQTKLASSTAAISERITSQKALATAIGQGYEAARSANVEMRLMQELGEHFGDSEWMHSHSGDVSRLRSGFGSEYDAQHQTQTATSIDKLNDQIELERELATVQTQGAEAVRQAELAIKLKKIAEDNDAASAKKLMAAQVDLYNIQRRNADLGQAAKLNEQADATERLAAATLKGADAVRQADLTNRLLDIQRENGGTIGSAGVAAIRNSAAANTKSVSDAAAHADRVQEIQDRINILSQAKQTLAVEIAIRDLENQKLQAMVQQTLQLGTARDGFRAFFLEMQENAETTATLIYNSLNSALDKTSDNLANMATEKRPKGGWSQMWGGEFKDIGHQALSSGIKSSFQGLLGKLGNKFHIPGKADGSNEHPFTVIVKNSGALRTSGFSVPSVAGSGGGDADADSGSSGKGWLSWIGSIASLFGGSRAAGGDMDPGKIYQIAEAGEGEIVTPRNASTVTPLHKIGGGETHNHFNYNIDAKGADLGAHNRIARAIEMAHKDAVTQSIRGQHEMAHRTPRGKR